MFFMKTAAPLVVCMFSLALSAPTAQNESSDLVILPEEGADVASTTCGDIIISSEQGYTLFWASDVWECLQDVPFDPAVATRFIRYYNQTLQFQSTLTLLKDPPEGYQQPPVDVIAELGVIQNKISSGEYKNQYVFEADLQLLINRIHDAHVYLSAGILAPFAFVAPFGLVSVSRNGKAPPEIYFQGEVVMAQLQGWEPSPITQINGINATDYLTAFAELNSEGYLEPHADWNALFEHPARDIQGTLSTLQSAIFYPGDELNFTQANGSEINTYWLATYSEAQKTGPLTTSGDFYNYFVLGIVPDSWDEQNPIKWWPDEVLDPNDNSTDTPEDTPPDYGCPSGNPAPASWCEESSGAYPNDPDIVQDELELVKGGVVTGYILEDISTGVLSIPSFYQTGNDTSNFFQAVDYFIANATNQNVSRIVIDLQQNSGGLTLLALSTFKRFFYGQDPWTGSRIRAHDQANTLGRAYSSWWDGLETGEDGALNPLYLYYASNEWVVTNRINPATGSNYSSWEEYYGPVSSHGGEFSNQQLYNLSDEVFDSSGFQGWHPFGYGQSVSKDPNMKSPAWAPENIVLLTDGLCNSACAYFVELMTQQGGVKTVVVGGQPKTGPMQTASGNRGSRLYSAEALDFDFAAVNDTLEDQEALSRLGPREDQGMWINFAGFNIRDSVRDGDDIPMQFKYEAADCRIYYTLANIYNLTQLWYDAAAATWDDSSLCVEDSTGYSTHKNNTSPKPPPVPTAQVPNLNFESTRVPDLNISSTVDLINFKTKKSISSTDVVQCPATGSCGGATECYAVPVTCPDGSTIKSLEACLPTCSNVNPSCAGGMQCVPTSYSETKKRVPAKRVKGGVIPAKYEPVVIYDGYCQPASVDTTKYPNLGCPRK